MAFSRKGRRYFSIFNENSCAKISGEFYMYLVFNLEELFYARARTSSPNKSRRIKDVILIRNHLSIHGAQPRGWKLMEKISVFFW